MSTTLVLIAYCLPFHCALSTTLLLTAYCLPFHCVLSTSLLLTAYCPLLYCLLRDIFLLAAMLSTLREREKKNEVRPDPDLDAFMKAQATEGKSGSVNSELVLRLLGLQVSLAFKFFHLAFAVKFLIPHACSS